jgi:glycosyltransferase involved in cell wall biosynthesis
MPTAEVSTIIPVRNGAAFIEDALKSVYEQSVAPTEVIVIDDGSEDDTASIVKRFSRVIYEKQPLSDKQLREIAGRI